MSYALKIVDLTSTNYEVDLPFGNESGTICVNNRSPYGLQLAFGSSGSYQVEVGPGEKRVIPVPSSLRMFTWSILYTDTFSGVTFSKRLIVEPYTCHDKPVFFFSTSQAGGGQGGSGGFTLCGNDPNDAKQGIVLGTTNINAGLGANPRQFQVTGVGGIPNTAKFALVSFKMTALNISSNNCIFLFQNWNNDGNQARPLFGLYPLNTGGGNTAGGNDLVIPLENDGSFYINDVFTSNTAPGDTATIVMRCLAYQ